VSSLPEPWRAERAAAWAERAGWRLGCNFVPSTAVNQLEMWQAETFDPVTIDRELGWAAGLGMNSVRVFLHDLLFANDREGLFGRIDRYLEIAARHGIATLFVLFDSVWYPFPRPGPQPTPRPRVHNSRWVQGPGAAVLALGRKGWSGLGEYIRGVIGRYRDDPRVLGWDLVNEPDNAHPLDPPHKAELAFELVRFAFTCAREAGPSQPLTVGVWSGEDWREGGLPPAWEEVLSACDVVSFHDYGPLPQLRARVAALRRFGRPLWCTEMLARGAGSMVDPCVVELHREGVGAFVWGLVDGRTQTKFPWDSWQREYPEEPDPWHHDLLRADGTPYDEAEAALLRQLAGR
jgi:hypothetical protein